ncbi:hypothetical protein AC480_00600 [miscellaneous Crenarchaeota group archaeon SMTZ1-55]|nr:MAG: hypothetical protein AC480_00600 [miscellaneous Crenarchaeota group archaeon SMTZ1-55]
MTTRKLKLELNNGDGNKISVIITGHFHRDKILQLLDFIDLLDGDFNNTDDKTLSELSKIEKLQLIIKRKFPIGWFTSQELMIAYEDVLNEPIGLSTVSTYLYRLVGKNVLIRSGSLTERKYKLVRSHSLDKRTIIHL